MNISEKLLSIQSELKAPKNQYNAFGKYAYRNCEDIMEAIKPLLAKNKCILTVSDELEHVGDRYYIKSIVTFGDCESKETIVNTAYAREEEIKKGMDSSQVTGASSSYARKYALNGLFCIDDTKDSDTTNTTVKTSKPTSENGKKTTLICKECGKKITGIKSDNKVITAEQISARTNGLCAVCYKKPNTNN